MLYQLATGSLPFAGKNPHEVLRRIAEGKFADPRSGRPARRQALARIITRALARRPRTATPTSGRCAASCGRTWPTPGSTTCAPSCARYFADPAGYEAALPRGWPRR